jgi:poly-beta-1,6-N-acetyl-D-glucosamine synthase
MILDDMFQPLSIIRQGYRSVLDPRCLASTTHGRRKLKGVSSQGAHAGGKLPALPACAVDADPAESSSLSACLAQGDAPRRALPAGSSACLHAWRFPRFAIYAAFAALQVLRLGLRYRRLRYRIPVLHRIAAPASALLVLKAAAVVGLYKFLFTRGPLWKIWNSSEPAAGTKATETENPMPPPIRLLRGRNDIGVEFFE